MMLNDHKWSLMMKGKMALEISVLLKVEGAQVAFEKRLAVASILLVFRQTCFVFEESGTGWALVAPRKRISTLEVGDDLGNTSCIAGICNIYQTRDSENRLTSDSFACSLSTEFLRKCGQERSFGL